MSDERNKSYSRIGWGISASILLHLLVVAGFFVHLPLPMSEPQKEETVEVELVAPPEPQPVAPEETNRSEEPELTLPPPPKLEETKPAEAKPEEPKQEEPKPEEAEKQEQPPPPPPEPPKAEEAKKQEPPPSPPQPDKPEPDKPEPDKPEADKPEADKPESEQADQGKPQSLDVLRPVVEFAEENSGPRQSLDGDSPEDQLTPPDEAQPDQKVDEAPADASETSDTAEGTQGNPMPDEIAVPAVSAASADRQAEGTPNAAVPDDVQAALVLPMPKPQTPTKPKADAPADLSQAKRLFSVKDTGDAVARTAMGRIPREIRASQLCSTELREQLRHASPAYQPELLPSYRLPSGTVMEVRRAAFRAEAQWYDVSFRCEVDDSATKVVSFAFNIGSPVPRSEWRKRGFPDF
jgi:hypothetical protein